MGKEEKQAPKRGDQIAKKVGDEIKKTQEEEGRDPTLGEMTVIAEKANEKGKQ